MGLAVTVNSPQPKTAAAAAARIVAVPFPAAVARPFSSTVATPSSEVYQVRLASGRTRPSASHTVAVNWTVFPRASSVTFSGDTTMLEGPGGSGSGEPVPVESEQTVRKSERRTPADVRSRGGTLMALHPGQGCLRSR